MLIVGIDHGEERRAREYLPVEDERNPTARRPLGREYAEFVTREVMPFISAHAIPCCGAAAATGFGGSSYGAVAALYTALLKPGMFGRLLIESPSLYVGRGYLLRLARRGGALAVARLSGVGTTETSREDWNAETRAERPEAGEILGGRASVRGACVCGSRQAPPTPKPRGRHGCRRRWNSCSAERQATVA